MLIASDRVVTDEFGDTGVVGGAHEERTNADGKTSRIYVNDEESDNILDTAATMTHEVTHAQISQGTISDRGSDTLNEGYGSDNMNFTFSQNSDTLGTVNLSGNQHIGNNAVGPTVLSANNAKYDAGVDAERLDFDVESTYYYGYEKKVEEIVSFEQIAQQKEVNGDFAGARDMREEVSRLEEDVEAFENLYGTGDQAVQNISDEYNEIDDNNVAAIETVVAIVGGRKLIKEGAELLDNISLNTLIKLDDAINNINIPLINNAANKFLGNPAKYTQRGLDIVDSALPHGIPTPSLYGGTTFVAGKVIEKITENSNE